MRAYDGNELWLALSRMKPEARKQRLFVEIGSRSILKDRLEELVSENVIEWWEDGNPPSKWEINEAFRKLGTPKIQDILRIAWDVIPLGQKVELEEAITDSLDELLRDALEEKIKEERNNGKRRNGKRGKKLP